MQHWNMLLLKDLQEIFVVKLDLYAGFCIVFSVRLIYIIFSRAHMNLFSRSIEWSGEQGCLLEEGPDGMRLNIQESVSFPISMIDDDKVST